MLIIISIISISSISIIFNIVLLENTLIEQIPFILFLITILYISISRNENEWLHKILAIITGIRGQDGVYLAELLLHKGYHVVGTSHTETGSFVLPISGKKLELNKLYK
jgi:hypothetical protein